MKQVGFYPIEADDHSLLSGTHPVKKWEWLWKTKHVCPWWLAHLLDIRFRNRIHPPNKILGPWLEKGMTSLDVGCGTGFFSLAMAELVGPEGLVLSVDIQARMLSGTLNRAREAGLHHRIRTIGLTDDSLILPRGIDFALAFWMAHEVGDLPLLLGRIDHYLNPGGRLLLVEPLVHVAKRRFALESILAMETGLRLEAEPRIRFSRAALFQKG
jgi:SAM-dependent methyltransferase